MLVRDIVMHVAAQLVPLVVFFSGLSFVKLCCFARAACRQFESSITALFPDLADVLQERHPKWNAALLCIHDQRHDVSEVFALSSVHKSPSIFQPFEEGFVIIGATT